MESPHKNICNREPRADPERFLLVNSRFRKEQSTIASGTKLKCLCNWPNRAQQTRRILSYVKVLSYCTGPEEIIRHMELLAGLATLKEYDYSAQVITADLQDCRNDPF